MRRLLCHRRYWIAPLLIWTAVVLASFFWNAHSLRDHSESIALQQARFVSGMIETFRLWNAEHGGVYAFADDDTPPNPYLDVPLRDLTAPDGRRLTMVNPAYMTRQVAELIGDEEDFSVRLTSMKPLNPINTPLEWEVEALARAEAGDEEFHVITQGERGRELRYMLALPTREACLQCHAKQGYQVGDIRGALTVTFDYAPFEAAKTGPMGHVVAIHLIIWSLLSLLTVVGLSRYREQLQLVEQIRDRQEDLIEERTTELQAEIAERQQRESELRMLRRALEYSPASVVVTDIDSRIVFVNRKFTEVTGYSEEEVLGENPRIMQSGETAPETYEALYATLLDGGKWKGELLNQKKNGALYWEQVSISPVTDPTGQLTHFVAVKEDITERKHRDGEIWRLAHYDPLTGLANRTLFKDLLYRGLERAQQSGRYVGLLYIDLDGFKPINDTLGHEAGDQVLKQVAARLRDVIRDTDAAARLGGDEFAALLFGLRSTESIGAIAEKVVATIAHPYELEAGEARLSASVGIAVYPGDATDGETLLQRADQAMYRAKEGGKDRYCMAADDGTE